MSLAFIESQFEEAKKTLDNFISNPKNAESIEQSAQLMVKSIHNGGKVISCGNGGSMSDAMHFAEELTGRYRDNRKSLPAIAISDPGYLTCAGNDFGYDFVFSRFIEGMGQEGDTLLAISTSGNSANVVNAAKAAREKGMKVVALTGKKGGELANHCDVEVRVTHDGYADRIQEIHIKVIHCFIGLIEKELIK
ncbi:D-sedoheptulose 7-phosphate isomerase [Salibacter halophilus]|uniref:Phosphoheptose isomerase n=1 Tax=Salibacter halophilus TaxID=1803916 RepID=A0A6N6M5L3_9FLAO|nr:D-sedoheptulose 7-phosphate isomerase [Salibacter halophilus]KAB1063240.1 D-sedoheptulose 7-phosphate isomerase [Salibacter halophilus]